MKQGVKIILLTLLLGVIWVTGLTNADSHNSDTVENYCISNYTQTESFEEYLHDANDNSQLHISNQRRTNSSSQSRSFKKTTAEVLIQKLRVFPLHLIKHWIETSSHLILRTADGGN